MTVFTTKCLIQIKGEEDKTEVGVAIEPHDLITRAKNRAISFATASHRAFAIFQKYGRVSAWYQVRNSDYDGNELRRSYFPSKNYRRDEVVSAHIFVQWEGDPEAVDDGVPF